MSEKSDVPGLVPAARFKFELYTATGNCVEMAAGTKEFVIKTLMSSMERMQSTTTFSMKFGPEEGEVFKDE